MLIRRRCPGGLVEFVLAVGGARLAYCIVAGEIAILGYGAREKMVTPLKEFVYRSSRAPYLGGMAFCNVAPGGARGVAGILIIA